MFWSLLVFEKGAEEPHEIYLYPYYEDAVLARVLYAKSIPSLDYVITDDPDWRPVRRLDDTLRGVP